jgi:hypothetical protein
VEFALLTMFKYIIIGGKVTKRLTIILDRHLGQDAIHAISGIVRLCLECALAHSAIDDPLVGYGLFARGQYASGFSIGAWDGYSPIVRPDPTFHNQKMNLFFRTGSKDKHGCNDTLFSIIDFIVGAAGHSTAFRQSLLDAGAPALVLAAFAEGLPILSDIMDAFIQHADALKPQSRDGEQVAESLCISVSAICTETHKLLDAIQTPALQSLLRSQMFIARRQLCRFLIDALLGESGDPHDAYAEIRVLFGEIIG